MKMARIVGGIVAGVVVGLSLMVGSAFAYEIGDKAANKVVPYYEVGGALATIIGVQTLAVGDNDDDATNDTFDHLIVTVRVHGTGADESIDTYLCMAENQFGYVVLQESAATEGQEIAHRGLVLSMAEDEIADTGYVTLTATDRVGDCSVGLTTQTQPVDVDPPTPGTDADEVFPAIAAWTIMQDVGGGFFGTEIPTVTNNAMGLLSVGATSTAPVISRYDINPGNESVTDIYVWLKGGEDTTATPPNNQRVLRIAVHCEDGEVVDKLPDPTEADSDNTKDITVPAPGPVTVIDPTAGDLGEATAMCLDNEGDRGRGVLGITTSKKSGGAGTSRRDGMVWSHISQRGANFRMNFLGYDPPDLPEPEGDQSN